MIFWEALVKDIKELFSNVSLYMQGERGIKIGRLSFSLIFCLLGLVWFLKFQVKLISSVEYIQQEKSIWWVAGGWVCGWVAGSFRK